jgi:hypothetical protein
MNLPALVYQENVRRGCCVFAGPIQYVHRSEFLNKSIGEGCLFTKA